MQPETEHLDALIIGGGISGLACLWRLRRLGFHAVCVEASGRVGGSILSHRRDAFLVEGGATSVQPSPELLELVRAIGLEGEIVRVPERLPRFVYRHGRLHAVPFGAAGLLTTSLLSGIGKCRLLAELWVSPRRDGAEESVEAFVARRFGREAAAAIAAPFVAGTFAGDVARLSASGIFPTLVELERAYGGVIRGMVARRGRANGESLPAKGAMISFREGLETLPLRLHERLGEAVELGVRAEQIERRESFQVSLRDGHGARAVTARAVVVATSPVAAASLLDSLVPDASRAVAELDAPPVACVSLAWRSSRVDHSLAGFGFLSAPGEATRILGCFWPASVFPDRAPPDHAALTSFVGGARDPEAATLDEAALVDLVARDLGRVVGATGSPLVLSVDRHPTAIPQYTIGHHDRLRRIRAGLTAAPGLFVAGNFFAGIGVGECVRQATTTAQDVADFLQFKGQMAVELP